jgi:putative PIG3 family NAD(P)H quinone oxidoreductase
MRVLHIHEPGGPEVLTLVERPTPEPGPGEVRIRVRAMGVNRADVLQRRGRYPAPPGVPADVPGLEVAGEIDAIGPGAEGTLGAPVMALVAGGGYSEAVIVHGRETMAVPAGWSMVEAAAAPEAYLTAFDALFTRGEALPGERVLIHAVGSGVGLAALQLARAAGCHVAGTSRAADKLARAVALGLHTPVLVPRDGPLAFPEADVIVDLVGGAYVEAGVRALAPRGRLVVVGLLAGATTNLPLGMLLAKRLRVEGTVLRARPLEEKITLARTFAGRGLALLGEQRPVVDSVWPAERVADAHRHMEADTNVGKIVLTW